MSGWKENKFVSRETADGKTARIPVGIIHGARPGEHITIYAGQHGTEYAGIDAVHNFYRKTDPDQVTGTVICALATNEESLLRWIQFAPTTPEIQDMMKELAQGSQYIINCHGGEFSEGMCPYVICRLLGRDDLDAQAMAMAEAFGLPYISLSKYRGEPPPDPSGVRPAWWLWPKKGMADELQIPEITPEVGQEGERDGQNLMLGGICNVLRRLGILEGEAREPAVKPKIIGNRHWLTAVETGLFFPAVHVCDDVRAGQLLGTVRDYFGNVLQEVFAPGDAKVMNINSGMPVTKDAFLLWLAEFD